MSNLAAQYSIPGASLLPTVTLAPSESSALNSLIASATSADPSLASYIANANLSTLDYDAVAYSLNQSQTGCLRIGALPVALAMNDTCLPGFLCKWE
nr:hypothetical protein CFP56_22213 [Quercus suber]